MVSFSVITIESPFDITDFIKWRRRPKCRLRSVPIRRLLVSQTLFYRPPSFLRLRRPRGAGGFIGHSACPNDRPGLAVVLVILVGLIVPHRADRSKGSEHDPVNSETHMLMR
jgi:hypothetical protein